jgi:hypothetical protein
VGVGPASAALRRTLPLTPAIPTRSKCWGRNFVGQLGLGDTNNRGDGANEMGANLMSVDLGAGWTAVEVAAGWAHTCARLEKGEARALKCWGRNGDGQLGLGDTNDRGDGGGAMGDSLPSVPLGALCPGWACPARYTGLDGGPCVACEAGTFKSAVGAADCETCPAWTSSASGSNELDHCKCVAGYTAASDGVACGACDEGTFSSVGGTAACETCPANSESSTGSVLCYCSAGFTGIDGGPCEACSDCTSAVTFTVTLAMSIADFGSSEREAYVNGVAEAVSVASSTVAIASVTEHFTRRRLLASTLEVETTVTVSQDKAVSVFFAAKNLILEARDFQIEGVDVSASGAAAVTTTPTPAAPATASPPASTTPTVSTPGVEETSPVHPEL